VDTGAEIDPRAIARRSLDSDKPDDAAPACFEDVAVTEDLSERQTELLLLVLRRGRLDLDNDRRRRAVVALEQQIECRIAGPDDYHHVIALCPTCHRRVHHGQDGDSYNDSLSVKLRVLEPI
jgi:hypothetical protein